MKKLLLLSAFFAGTFTVSSQNFSDSLRAFPGAEGYGAYVTGGRGGRVHYVLHTRDLSGPLYSPVYKSSLRAALKSTDKEPLTVVFLCGGVIDLAGDIECSRSNLTIAGQTALGDGICIKGHNVKFSGKNVIIRHVRFRPGDVSKSNKSALSFENGGNFIIDHCSFSWSMEENMTVYDNYSSTIQWCMLTESLYMSDHAKGARAYAAQWGGQTASYHHNLLAHHNSRMPRQNGNTSNDYRLTWDYRNNVHYNWGSDGAFYGGGVEQQGGYSHSNLVNNYYVPGPATTTNKNNQYFCAPSGGRPAVTGEGGEYKYGYGLWWLSGNVMKGNDAKTADNFSGLSGSQSHRATAEFEIPPEYAVTTTSAEEAYRQVLAGAGAMLPARDSIDRRIVREVKAEAHTFVGKKEGKKGIIDSQNDLMPQGSTSLTWDAWNSHYRGVQLKSNSVDTFLVTVIIRPEEGGDTLSASAVRMPKTVDTDSDGMPDWWETANGLNPNDAADRNRRAANKYTMLEVYLNGFPHEDAPADVLATAVAKEHIPQPHLRLYPNPASTTFSVEAALEPALVEVYNLAGQKAAAYPANGA
ncbi:MAG: hypothetical protein LBO71_02200, partial [Prevotellaceae bacterium]|nr:hypothetical protein [Prevotellaceae bacterium]